jgi:hypothetical protein
LFIANFALPIFAQEQGQGLKCVREGSMVLGSGFAIHASSTSFANSSHFVNRRVNELLVHRSGHFGLLLAQYNKKKYSQQSHYHQLHGVAR